MRPRGRLAAKELKGTRWVWLLGGLKPRELLKRVISDAARDRVLGFSAQLSFYFLLAFFPLLIFVSSLAGIVLSNDQALSRRVMTYLRPTMPDAAADLVESIIDEVLSGSSHASLGIGLLFAIWAASFGMEAIIEGMNAAFDVREFRTWWKRRLLAISMTVFTGFAILLVLGAILLGGMVSTWLATSWNVPALTWLWSFAEWAIVLLFAFATVSLIYMYAPNLRYQPWVATLPGTFVALGIWLAASLALRLYVDLSFGSYVSMYGSMGAAVVIMLWLYVTSAALLIGAEVNSEIRWAASEEGSQEAQKSLEESTEE
jgi:membrane protein